MAHSIEYPGAERVQVNLEGHRVIDVRERKLLAAAPLDFRRQPL